MFKKIRLLAYDHLTEILLIDHKKFYKNMHKVFETQLEITSAAELQQDDTFVHVYLAAVGFFDDIKIQQRFIDRYPKLNLLTN